MPIMRTKDKCSVVAIVCADLHLSLKPPIARAGEPNWFEAMRHPLQQLDTLQEEYGCPIICAGDIFDRWNSPPELINFALDWLPDMYAIPGQHDLPLHDMEQVRRSAYHTLVLAGKIETLGIGAALGEIDDNLWIVGFPWGTPITNLQPGKAGPLHVAVSHAYAWIDGCSYPNAPKEMNANQRVKALEGYDVVIFGDNHEGFLTKRHGTTIFNCGSLMRRKSDEIKYRPQVGLLMMSGEVKPVCLNTQDDVIVKVNSQAEAKANLELEDFLEKLASLEDQSLDFVEAIKRALDEQGDSAIRKIILEALENG